MDLENNYKQVYWDDDKNEFYWIEWIETGNNDIPHRHYVSTEPKEHFLSKAV